MNLKDFYLNRLNSFGTERKHEFYVKLGIISAEKNLPLPYEENLTLEEYLDKHNLWYILYL